MRRQHGFTMVELVTVMVLLGVLAAIGIPRLMGENTTGAAVFGEQVTSALRLAQKTAVARRRTVCVATAPGALTLRIRSKVGFDERNCDTEMDGAADELYRSKDAAIVLDGAPAQLHFQPDGTITDQNGAQFARLSMRITSSGALRRTIHLDGRTGYVD